MRIKCPICGERDLREFQYLGSAKLLDRPQAQDVASPENAKDQEAFYNYVYLRENVEGMNEELWLHEAGCRAWIWAKRDTKTHEFHEMALAKEKALK